MKKVLITQSNYIPWKGYFDSINMVDEVILYDNVQYTKRDWRNRNMIKTPQGVAWLSIPVEVKGKFLQKIDETRISERNWNEKHWKTLNSNYSKAPCFKEVKDFVASLYIGATMELLSEINYWFLTELSKWLGIQTKFRFSGQFQLAEENPTQRLVLLCKKADATHYFSGPAARAYLEPDRFEKESIDITYLNYDGYQEYPQLNPPFSHSVTILDLLFNTGKNSPGYMKSFSQ